MPKTPPVIVEERSDAFVRDYRAAAERATVGLSSLSTKERALILRTRLLDVADKFATIPNAENWAALYDLMCAIQNERNVR